MVRLHVVDKLGYHTHIHTQTHACTQLPQCLPPIDAVVPLAYSINFSICFNQASLNTFSLNRQLLSLARTRIANASSGLSASACAKPSANSAAVVAWKPRRMKEVLCQRPSLRLAQRKTELEWLE